MKISSVFSHLATLHMQWKEIIDNNFYKTVKSFFLKGNVKYPRLFMCV